MSIIKEIKFTPEGIRGLEKQAHGTDWPVVYILKNKKEAYIGETIKARSRAFQHIKSPEKKMFNEMLLISDDEFNKSAILDIESWLIQYMSADGEFKIKNKNSGLKNHSYFDRQKYEAKFERIWDSLKKQKITKNTLREIKNSDIFKYSPYKSLSDDQFEATQKIYKSLTSKEQPSWMIIGGPGTGKTILAVYLMKYILEKKETKDLIIGLVVPMTSLRKTLKKVFRSIDGLSSNMIIGPSEVAKKQYDILFVDEAHRLSQRKNLANYASYDALNKKLGLPKESTQFDWIKTNSKQQVLFYDPNQTIRPGDVDSSDFSDFYAHTLILESQMRIEGGSEYMNFVENLFDPKLAVTYAPKDYTVKLHKHVKSLINEIKQHNKETGLSRIVAGYAWKWLSKKYPTQPDIILDGEALFWNSTNQDWPNSPNAINEVGCIHTVQGYDLNYVGVIIGPELKYDPEKSEFYIDPKSYHDFNGKRAIDDPLELKKYIINIYKTLLTRGIKGVHLYACDPGVREYLESKIQDR